MVHFLWNRLYVAEWGRMLILSLVLLFCKILVLNFAQVRRRLTFLPVKMLQNFIFGEQIAWILCWPWVFEMPLVSDEDLVKRCREGIQHLGCMVMIIQYKYQRGSDWICRQDGGPCILVHYYPFWLPKMGWLKIYLFENSKGCGIGMETCLLKWLPSGYCGVVHCPGWYTHIKHALSHKYDQHIKLSSETSESVLTIEF